MTERTEEAGLSGLLHITMGGRVVELRVLTIEETDAWLRRAGADIAAMETGDGAEPAELFATLMRAGTDAAVSSLAAYDVDGTLGGPDAIRAAMSPVELREAMEVVVRAALPFDADAARSVAAAYGGPTRLMAAGLALTMTSAMLPRLARSMPGPSDAGASATTPSGEPGPPSSSSSDGPTATSSNGRSPRPVATRSRTP